MGRFSTKERFGGNGGPIVEEGAYSATIAVIADLGPQETNFGKKDQIRIGFVLNHKNESGDYVEMSRTFTWSLHEKSALFPVAKAALGSKSAVAEMEDLEELLGKSVDLEVEHKEKQDGTGVYANIVGVFRCRGEAPDLEDWDLSEYWENMEAEAIISIHDVEPEPVETEPEPEEKPAKRNRKSAKAED